jgi:hypothetical protein
MRKQTFIRDSRMVKALAEEYMAEAPQMPANGKTTGEL